ncbi:hypothetical protein PFHG_04080 [Plasmodium falciparum HB3]|uniref:Uncharacterized protein n=1 Tax=Plasmodium falciparum (isolate HB3) TaxID=137071 RepID=A0A0L7KGA3_PLAFX|nr:hypothetical protein PFHG_04080 [Plasmodium falciparum HB3]
MNSKNIQHITKYNNYTETHLGKKNYNNNFYINIYFFFFFFNKKKVKIYKIKNKNIKFFKGLVSLKKLIVILLITTSNNITINSSINNNNTNRHILLYSRRFQ